MGKCGKMLRCQNENIDCWSDETLVWKQNCHKSLAMLHRNLLLPTQNRAGGGLTNVSPCKVTVIWNVVAFKQYGGLRRFVFFSSVGKRWHARSSHFFIKWVNGDFEGIEFSHCTCPNTGSPRERTVRKERGCFCWCAGYVMLWFNFGCMNKCHWLICCFLHALPQHWWHVLYPETENVYRFLGRQK